MDEQEQVEQAAEAYSGEVKFEDVRAAHSSRLEAEVSGVSLPF